MTTKIAAFFITLFVNIVIGVVVFFFLLLAMNGYSESDASYGLGAYVVLALLVSFVMAAGALVGVRVLTKREVRAWIAGLVAVTIFSVIGGGLKIACALIGVLVADYVRVHY